ncbi:MAG TPA: hypothetical protein VFD92_19325 [Candidatus Binatia bacterium]|nr:hypothetical protein [Candidatus Binatia bacterium]
MFFCEGEVWTIAFDGTLVHLRDARGMRYLARLLRDPGRPIPASDLVAACRPQSATGRTIPDTSEDAGTRAARDRTSVTKALKSAIDRIAAVSPGLGRHLAVSVRRGTACVYLPDPRVPIEWLGSLDGDGTPGTPPERPPRGSPAGSEPRGEGFAGGRR